MAAPDPFPLSMQRATTDSADHDRIDGGLLADRWYLPDSGLLWIGSVGFKRWQSRAV